MDRYEAARLLAVADAEIVEVRRDAEGWWALHHDMASHVRVWRNIPGWQIAAAAVEPEPEPEVPAVDVDGDGVPDGPAAQVLAWVGEDPDRARAALGVEGKREKTRSTLVAALEKLVD